jgi:hypothetical protein
MEITPTLHFKELHNKAWGIMKIPVYIFTTFGVMQKFILVT